MTFFLGVHVLARVAHDALQFVGADTSCAWRAFLAVEVVLSLAGLAFQSCCIEIADARTKLFGRHGKTCHAFVAGGTGFLFVRGASSAVGRAAQSIVFASSQSWLTLADASLQFLGAVEASGANGSPQERTTSSTAWLAVFALAESTAVLASRALSLKLRMREDVVGVFKLFLEKRLGNDFLKKELLFIFSKLFGVGFGVVEKLREVVL